ncbi:GTP 3',8-cyclase [Geodia barretti]|uniref:GTP 3',8-cyclase n=1 Tax=Geodia barretti TaxID=519541 RepID=A0AA35QUN4_GEOBA|nr:GTP 3',8-cyclase [Geodia barretti]
MSLNVVDTMGRSMRDLRISVTDRCNFRCPYCMPAEIFGEAYEFLPRGEILTFEEIARLTRLFSEFGVSKARITGGEPLLRTDLPELISQIAAIDGISDVTLTTNGYLLAQQAKDLKNAGLHRITVSLDSVDDEVFKQMNGRGFGTRRVLHAIQNAAEVGLTPIKINAVVQRGVNDHTIVDLARHFKGTGPHRPFHRVHGRRQSQRLEAGRGNYSGEVAERYLYRDGSGEIGVIASVTRPFCGACTRLRLSTDGQIFTCLFATRGTSLRDPMRAGASDDDLRDLISGIWTKRTDRYSEERFAATPDRPRPAKVEMYQIGG